MVGICRGEGSLRSAVFNTVFGKMDTTVFMDFYKSRFAEVNERGYSILQDFADRSNPDVFQD